MELDPKLAEWAVPMGLMQKIIDDPNTSEETRLSAIRAQIYTEEADLSENAFATITGYYPTGSENLALLSSHQDENSLNEVGHRRFARVNAEAKKRLQNAKDK